MGGALERVVRHLGAPSVDALDRLYGGWAGLVGPQLAAHTSPVSLKDGVLVIGVDDPAWSTQVRFLEASLLTRLEGELGSDAVHSVEVRVRPPGPSPRNRP